MLEKRYVIKKSGEREPFDENKLLKSIENANNKVNLIKPKKSMDNSDIITAGMKVKYAIEQLTRDITAEELHELVEKTLFEMGFYEVGKGYVLYGHDKKTLKDGNQMSNLDKRIVSTITVEKKEDGSVSSANAENSEENSNKKPTIASVQRDYIAGEWSRHFVNNYILDEEISKAHTEGIIHVHDTDYMAQQIHNCDLVNLEDMLQNGTTISGAHIDPPKSFYTACTITTQIIAQVASLQYGGQSITLSHIAPFVDVSRKKIKKRLTEEFNDSGIEYTEESLNKIVEKEVLKEINDGCQTLQYQIVTLQTTNGQAPFVTLFMYLNEVPEGRTRDDLALIIEAVLRQRIKGIKDNKGIYITPAFPKLIYVLQENNINEGSEYFDLTKLAAECSAKRMVPDYISEKIMMEQKGDVYPCMGCRSFLTPDRFTDNNVGNIANAMNYVEGKHKYYGRFNQGVVTLNLPDIACSSEKDEEKFWKIFDERLALCHRALRIRHEKLLGTLSDVAPILWQYGALARLKSGETIDKLLYNGYSSISLGYAGLAETVYYMKGVSHTSPEGKEFGMKVMKYMNDACAKWKAEENIDYSIYGTPLESTTYKFAKALQKRFGIIPHVSDKNYITNSYHVHVTEKINAFDKLTKEAEFQAMSPGGAISYVEVPNMSKNLEGVMAILKHIYNTIIYAEINSKLDNCDNCGYEGEIQIVKDESGKLIWRCPSCGTTNTELMHIARRVCGYISSNGFNQGRTQEIKERVIHVSVDES